GEAGLDQLRKLHQKTAVTAGARALARRRAAAMRAAGVAIAAGGVTGLLLALWHPPRARSPPRAPQPVAAETAAPQPVSTAAVLDPAHPAAGFAAPAEIAHAEG